MALGAQLGAIGRGAAVLPNNGAMNGFARAPIPHQRGFALIGNAYGGHAIALHLRVLQGFLNRGDHAFPYLFGLVLHLSGLGEVLAKLSSGAAQGLTLGIHHEGRASGCALIDGKKVLKGRHEAAF